MWLIRADKQLYMHISLGPVPLNKISRLVEGNIAVIVAVDE